MSWYCNLWLSISSISAF